MIDPLVRASTVLALAGFVSAAAAQQGAPATPPAATPPAATPPAAPAPAAPAAAASTPVPRHDCVKPGEYPGNLASDTQKRSWQKEYVGYVDCLKKFIEVQQSIAAPHVKASNAAIDEYNAGVKDYNEQIEKAKNK
ncbi:MAG TPA: hypothetical protein VF059_05320 [Casimicrobiaceae bacterium]